MRNLLIREWRFQTTGARTEENVSVRNWIRVKNTKSLGSRGNKEDKPLDSLRLGRQSHEAAHLQDAGPESLLRVWCWRPPGVICSLIGAWALGWPWKGGVSLQVRTF